MNGLLTRPIQAAVIDKRSTGLSFNQNELPGNIAFGSDEIVEGLQIEGRQAYRLKSGRYAVEANMANYFVFYDHPSEAKSCKLAVEADIQNDIWQFEVAFSSEEIAPGVFLITNDTIVNGSPFLEAETIPRKFTPLGVNWAIAGEDGEEEGLDYIGNEDSGHKIVDRNKGGCRPSYIVISINPDYPEGEDLLPINPEAISYKVDKLFIDNDPAPEFLVLQCYYGTKQFFSHYVQLQTLLQ